MNYYKWRDAWDLGEVSVKWQVQLPKFSVSQTVVELKTPVPILQNLVGVKDSNQKLPLIT